MRHWDDEALILDDFCQTSRTIDEIAEHLNLPHDSAREVIAYHRHTLSDETALIHEQPDKTTHLYIVTGEPDRISRWVRVRLRDGDTRLRTLFNVAQVAVRVTDGRKTEGKLARRTVTLISRLIEDFDYILADEDLAIG